MLSVEIFKKIDCSLNEVLYPVKNKAEENMKDINVLAVIFVIMLFIMLCFSVKGLIGVNGLMNKKDEVDLSSFGMLFIFSPLIFIFFIIGNEEQKKEKENERKKEEEKKHKINQFKTDKTVIEVLFAIKNKLTSEEYNKIYSFIEERNGFELPFITFQLEVIKSEEEAIKNEQERLRKENMAKKKLLLDISYENDK